MKRWNPVINGNMIEAECGGFYDKPEVDMVIERMKKKAEESEGDSLEADGEIMGLESKLQARIDELDEVAARVSPLEAAIAKRDARIENLTAGSAALMEINAKLGADTGGGDKRERWVLSATLEIMGWPYRGYSTKYAAKLANDTYDCVCGQLKTQEAAPDAQCNCGDSHCATCYPEPKCDKCDAKVSTAGERCEMCLLRFPICNNCGEQFGRFLECRDCLELSDA